MEQYTIQHIETKEKFNVPISWFLSEINRDRSSQWIDYDESDWKEGWYEWCEGDTYTLIGEEVKDSILKNN
jgi:hypothetical protein